jgi:HD-GYP domain-containing protein (c-di-GMP phosphodiesterase class II)
MGLAPEQLRVIARGAYLHDLGKIGIPDQILNKPGALDEAERRTMETHPTLGHQLASGAPTLREALPIILHHHERFDGGGYPAGLVGREIPLEARVVAIADVWDALTSDRAYRAGWEPERALAHIVAGSGTHFDPPIVDAFVALAAEWGVRLPDEPGRAEEAWIAAQTCHEVSSHGELVGVG